MIALSRSLPVAAFIAAIAVAGCGGGGGDGDASSTVAEQSGPPEATETVEEFADRLDAASAASAALDCDAVDEFNKGAGQQLPCSKKFAYAFEGLEVTGSKDLGSAAVVDITDGEFPDGASIVAAIHEDGRYRVVGNYAPSTIGLAVDQTTTEPEDQDLRDEAVDTYVEATREKDCDAYFDIALTPTQNKPKECELQFDPNSQIQPQLAAAPDAEPGSLGGTEAFGFHELDTGENYRVLTTIRNYGSGEDPGETPYVVLSYRSR